MQKQSFYVFQNGFFIYTHGCRNVTIPLFILTLVGEQNKTHEFNSVFIYFSDSDFRFAFNLWSDRFWIFDHFKKNVCFFFKMHFSTYILSIVGWMVDTKMHLPDTTLLFVFRGHVQTQTTWANEGEGGSLNWPQYLITVI